MNSPLFVWSCCVEAPVPNIRRVNTVDEEITSHSNDVAEQPDVDTIMAEISHKATVIC